jgi:hypothetical protein
VKAAPISPIALRKLPAARTRTAATSSARAGAGMVEIDMTAIDMATPERMSAEIVPRNGKHGFIVGVPWRSAGASAALTPSVHD